VPRGSAHVDPPGLGSPPEPSCRPGWKTSLLSWGSRLRTVTCPKPACRPSADISAVHPLPVAGATFGLEATSLEVLFHPRGFSPPRRVSLHDGSQVCCTLQPALGFAGFRIVKSVSQLPDRSPPARPPLEGHHHPKAVTRSPAPDAPLAFFLGHLVRAPLPAPDQETEAVTFGALIREAVLNGARVATMRYSVPSWA